MFPLSGAPEPADVPLVLHVIPSTVARGAQREARALTDCLDRPGVRHHRLLTLYAGAPEVVADLTLAHPGETPGVGLDLRLVRRLRSELAAVDPAVVVAHGSEPLKYLVPAMLFRSRPLAYYAIGTYSGSRGAAQEAVWRLLMRRPDVIVAEGEEVRTECIERFGVSADRVTYIPNGRDPALFHPTDESREPGNVVVFLGALTPGKRPDWFIAAVDQLRHSGVSFRARIIGDGPMRPELEGSAREAGVELMGSRSDVPELLRQADVMVFTSRAAGEGMPGVLIEAGLSGLPLVATDVPGVRSIVEPGVTGLVVPEDDPDGIADALRELLSRPELRASLGEAARHRCVEQFGLDAVAERWLSVLQPLLGPR